MFKILEAFSAYLKSQQYIQSSTNHLRYTPLVSIVPNNIYNLGHIEV